MATKNHFSNYENLFSAYRENVLNQNSINAANIQKLLDSKKKQLDALEKEAAEIKAFFANPPKEVPNVDTRKSQEFLPKVTKAEKELADLKASLKVLSEAARQTAEKELALTDKNLSATKSEIATLTAIIDNPETEAKDRTAAKAKRTKAENRLKTLNATIEKYRKTIEEDDKNKAIIFEAETKLNELKTKLEAIKKDEKTKTYDKNSSIREEISTKRARRHDVAFERSNLIKEIAQIEQNAKNASTTITENLVDFRNFLAKNGFSTVHAEELFELYKNPNKKLKSFTKDEFKLRKQHPTRDKFLKKFVAPTAITAGTVGIASGLIAASKMIAGSKWLFVTITSNPAVNFWAAALPGAAIGTVAAIATIKLKDVFTKLHYKNKYGSVEKMLNEPESTKLDELLAKMENTKDDILDLRTGSDNKFKKFGRAIVRTAKNIVNRNRIHHIESITEKLVEKFNIISSNPELSIDKKLEALAPIQELLTKINNFYAKDIKKSKVFAMLNCKETDNGHTHKETLENLDIYAKLSMYLEKINDMEKVSSHTKRKAHSQVKTDLKRQNIVAERLLNGEDVTNLVAKKYLELVKASSRINTPKSKMISNHSIVNGELRVTFADGKSTTYTVENATNISKVESVNLGRTLLITYADGEQASIPSTLTKVKINLNMAGEYKVYDKLQETAVIDYLVEQKGFNKETILDLIDKLKASKYNKDGKEKSKPTAFMKSKAYKENPDYAKIIEEVAVIIKNPNIVYVENTINA